MTTRTQKHVQRVLDLLDGVRSSGKGWAARCPAHDDRNQSLSVGIGGERAPGAVLQKCHAGCGLDAILDPLGLTSADLFADSTRRGSTVENRYRYLDQGGRTLYAVDRTNTRGKRSWRHVHIGPDGAWASGRGTASPVLYRLPDLLGRPDETVWITEGERDADSIAARGRIATTVASGSWEGVDTSVLKGRSVVVVVDSDRTGWKKGRKSVEQAEAAGAVSTAVLRPGDSCKDVTEWLEHGNRVSDLVPVDLETDQPPVERWENPESPKRTKSFINPKDGTHYWAKTPESVLWNQAISELAIWVYSMLDAKAGNTGIAKFTIRDLAKARGRSDTRKVSGALRDLRAAGLIEPGEKRGWWRVINPSRVAPADKNSFLPEIPNTNPRKPRDHASEERANTRTENDPDTRDHAAENDLEQTCTGLHRAFPGSVEIESDDQHG